MSTITNKTIIDNQGSSKRMPAGTHIECRIVPEVTAIKQTQNGNTLIEVWLENTFGERIKKSIFFPKATPNIKDGESTEQATERELNDFISQCTDILIAVKFDNEAATISAPTVAEWANKFIEKLSKDTTACNIIVQYDTNYEYTEVPKYGWIEKYTPAAGCRLRVKDTFRMSKPEKKTSGLIVNNTEGPLY